MSQDKASSQPLDLGVVGNCQVASLIDRQGRHVWWCPERFDQDPVFCSLVDGTAPAETGFMQVELAGLKSTTQKYMRNSAVLATTLIAEDDASCQLIDFAPRFKQHDRIFRPKLLIRRIVPQNGTCRIRIQVRPMFDAGTTPPTITHGSHHLRYVSDYQIIRLTTDAAVSYVAEERWFTLRGPITLILGPDEPFSAAIDATAQEFLRQTQNYWRDWVRDLYVPFDWQDPVIRAAITLKLCNYEETGAIVAALTTSIPEAAGTVRNWDYRFCWLRDAYFVVNVLNRLGATRTMEDFIAYIENVIDLDPGGVLKPVYGIIPGTPLPEREEPGLRGFLDNPPVRFGNLAENQTQNDSYGNVILASAQMFFDRRLPSPSGLVEFNRLERIGEMAAEKAFEPDAGLWEYRGKLRAHCYSSLMCWVACDRLGNIAGELEMEDRKNYWHEHAARIRTGILERYWDAELDSFVDAENSGQVDASLLLLPQLGFIDAQDPRFLGTLKLIETRLRRGNHLMRYSAQDDFGEPENAFTICSFWYVDALCAVGRKREAHEIFEHIIGCCNHLGLLSEDIDPKTNLLWGNFPQSYSMVGLILSALRLSRSWEDAFWRGLSSSPTE